MQQLLKEFPTEEQGFRRLLKIS